MPKRALLALMTVLGLLAALAPSVSAAPSPVLCAPDDVMKRGCAVAPVMAAGPGYGWVRAKDDPAVTPMGTWYTPDTRYQYSSATGGPSNQVRHDYRGVYLVYIDGVTNPGGVAHVTSLGENNKVRCKLLNFQPQWSGQLLSVRCQDFAGQLADSEFTASYTNLRTSYYAFGYSSLTDNYNTAGVVVDGVGAYHVDFAVAPASGGTVVVTAEGQTTEWCKSGSWYPSGSVVRVNIRCYLPNGTPSDTRFDVTFVDSGNIVGEKNYGGVPSLQSAYVWIQQGYPGVWTPWRFGSPTTDPFSWLREDVGKDLVRDPVSGTVGTAHVTAYSNADTTWCNLADFGLGFRTRCYAVGGARADSDLVIAYIGKHT
jgi:hypothetical protein